MLAVLTEQDARVIEAALLGVPVVASAVFAFLAARRSKGAETQATAANRAVNDVGDDQPKLRDLVLDTNAVVIGLQADVQQIQVDRAMELTERNRRQIEHDEEHAKTRAVLEQLAPVLEDWRRSHPEIRPDLPADLDDPVED